MGNIYYAVNIADKTYFELGKGLWYRAFLRELLDPNRELVDSLTKIYHFTDLSDAEETCQYWNNYVIGPLRRFANNQLIEVIDEGADDLFCLRCLDYVCVGSKYYCLPEDKSQYQDNVDYINRKNQTNGYRAEHRQHDLQWLREYHPEMLMKYKGLLAFK